MRSDDLEEDVLGWGGLAAGLEVAAGWRRLAEKERWAGSAAPVKVVLRESRDWMDESGVDDGLLEGPAAVVGVPAGWGAGAAEERGRWWFLERRCGGWEAGWRVGVASRGWTVSLRCLFSGWLVMVSPVLLKRCLYAWALAMDEAALDVLDSKSNTVRRWVDVSSLTVRSRRSCRSLV
jgi:hypothetical protein